MAATSLKTNLFLCPLQPIVHFWFEELNAKQHFAKVAALDATIRARFGHRLEAAAKCELFDNSVNGKTTMIVTQEGNNLQIKESSSWPKLQKLLTT